MIQPSAFRRSPADLPGSCRRTRCPTASYTTPGDTIPMTPWGIAYANYAPMAMREGRFSERDFGRCVDALREEYVRRRRFVLRIVPPPSGGFFQKVQAQCLEARGFRPGSPEGQKTLLLDLAISPDEIRRNLDPKWRGSLVRAEKNGIGI